MKITQVSYSKTWNLGNFNSHRAEATIEVQEGDDIEKVQQEAATLVYRQLKLAEDAWSSPTPAQQNGKGK